MAQDSPWTIHCEGLRQDFTAFATAFRMNESPNITGIAKNLTEGVVACPSLYVAGIGHIRRILDQATESWARKIFIARNRSIDLLVRITCQSQISKALMASKANARELAVFGVSIQEKSKWSATAVVERAGGIREDSLLEIYPDKERFLRRFHNIPSYCPRNRIADLLAEKSALLAFAK